MGSDGEDLAGRTRDGTGSVSYQTDAEVSLLSVSHVNFSHFR